MKLSNLLKLYVLECKAFWREYRNLAKINLIFYIIFCLSLYLIIYIAMIFDVNHFIILNTYLLLLIIIFGARNFENKVKVLTSKKTNYLYTLPLSAKSIVKLKSLKFRIAFILDSTIIFFPLFLILLIQNFNLIDLILYTIMGFCIGGILSFYKQYIAIRRAKHHPFSYFKSFLLGVIFALLIVQGRLIIDLNSEGILKFYKEILTFNLSGAAGYIILACAPLIAFKNHLYIIKFNHKKTGRSEPFSFIELKGEVSRQIIISNREGGFLKKLLNSLFLYIGFFVSLVYFSQQIGTANIFSDDLIFIFSIVIISRNTKLFFISRPVHNDAGMVYSFVFAKYKISKILISRILINISTAFISSIFVLAPLFYISHAPSQLIAAILLVGTLFILALSLIQEYYSVFKVKFFETLENEHRGSMIKRVIWESSMIMVTLYGFLFIKAISMSILHYYLIIIGFLFLAISLVFFVKIMKGNENFYGELKEYY